MTTPELNAKIVRTDHGEFLTVLEFHGHVVYVDWNPIQREWCVDLAGGIIEITESENKQDVIAAAERWLIDDHLKGGE